VANGFFTGQNNKFCVHFLMRQACCGLFGASKFAALANGCFIANTQILSTGDEHACRGLFGVSKFAAFQNFVKGLVE
jgi:hypothetical protein